jgi:endoglucanase
MLNPPPGRPGWRTAARAAVATALLLSAAAGAPAAGAPDATSTATRLYADPGSPLLAAAARLRASGHQSEAAVLRQIARTPSGIWLAGEPYDMQEVRRVTLAAARAHAIPVIVAYNLPDRDACGKLSTAPRRSASGYQRWIRQLAAAIGTGDDIVIVEPDGLPDIVRGCLSPAQARERYELLRYAMQHLGALPNARVYLDAGNPGMFGDPAQLVGPLERAGIRYGRGFSANVSNFQWTTDVVTWSQQLEHALGGRVGAVIDTSRNGNGPYTGHDAPQWCNPPGRALGPAPKLDPGPAGIDAYLWVKDPGASDGPCNGGPAAGRYWPQYAADLADGSDRR